MSATARGLIVLLAGGVTACASTHEVPPEFYANYLPVRVSMETPSTFERSRTEGSCDVSGEVRADLVAPIAEFVREYLNQQGVQRIAIATFDSTDSEGLMKAVSITNPLTHALVLIDARSKLGEVRIHTRKQVDYYCVRVDAMSSQLVVSLDNFMRGP